MGSFKNTETYAPKEVSSVGNVNCPPSSRYCMPLPLWHTNETTQNRACFWCHMAWRTRHGGFLSSLLPFFINCRNKVDYGTIQVYPLLECKAKSSQFSSIIALRILSNTTVATRHKTWQLHKASLTLHYCYRWYKTTILNIDTIDHFVLQSQYVFDVDCLLISQRHTRIVRPRKQKLDIISHRVPLPYIKHNRLMTSMNSIN